MKPIYKKFLSYLIPIILLSLIIVMNREILSEMGRIKEVPVFTTVYISLLFILSQLIYGLRLKIIMKKFGLNLRFTEWFGLINIQSFGNYLPLNAGVLSNMLYLKSKRKLSSAEFVSYITGDTFIKMSVFGLIGLILVINEVGLNFYLCLILTAFILAGPVILLIPGIGSTDHNKNRILKWIVRVREGWKSISSDPLIMLQISVTHVLILFLISWRFYIIFRVLGYEISIASITVLSIFTNVIRIASLFPGNLGLRESIAGTVTNIFGYTFSSGIVTAIIDRIICTIWIIVGGTFFSIFFVKKISRWDSEV